VQPLPFCLVNDWQPPEQALELVNSCVKLRRAVGA
jgi:hypothetical protein